MECLQTTNSSIIIQGYAFNLAKQLSDWIKFFKKARSIEFKGWNYGNDYIEKDIEFEGVMINQVVFTNCIFKNTKMIKKVIIDSGLAKMLDKVTFDRPREGKEKGGVEKMVLLILNVKSKVLNQNMSTFC